MNIFSLYNNLPADAAWRGCVEARPEPYDIDDTAPTAGTPATMFVPFFSPDEGGDDVDANNWVTSGTYDRTDVFGLGGGIHSEYSGFLECSDHRAVQVSRGRHGEHQRCRRQHQRARPQSRLPDADRAAHEQ